MEICRFHCIAVIVYCMVLYPCLVAKTFSLNEAIAAETAIASANKTAKNTDTTAERISLNKALSPPPSKLKRNKQTKKPTGHLKSDTKKISPQKYRKLFQIDIPLKPKRLHFQKYLLNKRNQALKRDTSRNERFNQKYVPLLRNLGLFFNSLLSSTESENFDDRHSYRTDGADDVDCPCLHQSELIPKKETAAPAKRPIFEKQTAPKAAAKATHNITPRNVSRLRQNQDIPLLSTRDPSSRESNNNGLSARSRASRHRSAKRNITRYNRDSEYDSRRQGDNANAAFYDETTPSVARDSTSCSGADRGSTGNGTDTGSAASHQRINENATTYPTQDTTREIGGNIETFENEDQFKVSGNETEPSELIRGRLRGALSEHQVSNSGESLQPSEDHEESHIDVAEHFTSDQPITERNGALTTEDKGLRTTDEAVTLKSGSLVYKDGPKDKKVVIVFDGYSVAKGKYGENNIAEKAIRIQ